MEGLAALEVAIKQLVPVTVPTQPEGSSLPTMRMYEQNVGPMYGHGQPSAPSHAAPVVPQQVVQPMAAMPTRQEVPQPRFEDETLRVPYPYS